MDCDRPSPIRRRTTTAHHPSDSLPKDRRRAATDHHASSIERSGQTVARATNRLNAVDGLRQPVVHP
ncbi:hypothetical protein FRX31_034288 [Thalictrum thalictroides]|uniref:Uncharacterized protein n=1 Tax=Thalictrum thalictroides TaxID=46969 RepID=A0A7J6UU79_THATH|nr:hypothetical protein FRX31_034288 [Thalictrum thalictroides]